jgi:hypothetical protein
MTAYRLRAYLIEHDYRFSGWATTVVDLPAEPTAEEAERLLWGPAADEVVKYIPDASREHLRVELSDVTVTLVEDQG